MKLPYKNLHWHERQVVPHSYPLTEEERLELASVMSEAKCELSKLENELAEIKKEYKEKIDGVAGTLSKAAYKYKSGLSDPVDVECDIYQDFESEEMVYVTVEGDEEIKRRPMLEGERRPTLMEMLDPKKSNQLPFEK